MASGEEVGARSTKRQKASSTAEEAGHVAVAPWGAPVTATWTVPGSKSMTNRGLVLAALAEGTPLGGAQWPCRSFISPVVGRNGGRRPCWRARAQPPLRPLARCRV